MTGIEFDLSFGKAHARPFGPSLDQIKPGAGYTEENTQVVVWIYNAAKTNGEHEDERVRDKGHTNTKIQIFRVITIGKEHAEER